MEGDVVYMKLNCEGSEVAILENLLATGEVGKLTGALVDWDALKVPSQAHRVEAVGRALRTQGIRYFTPDQVQYGMINNYGGIRNWLHVAGASQGGPLNALRSSLYQSKFILDRNYNGYYKMRLLNRYPTLRRLLEGLRGVWP